MRLVSRPVRYLLLLGVLALVVLPLMFVRGQFGGSDDAASKAIADQQPGFKPWFQPLWKPPSTEIESLLFAVQAAIGAGTIGYVLGRMHGAAKERETYKKKASPSDVDH
ncbi:MAG TPA: energy-coupling factor ABC transporter substrate-binding protein [Steroidobacteraceae bacterium]|nr:energy-coupling factor ABC transporter substrate-binding protein [Steroidobacteraceae bacterium]